MTVYYTQEQAKRAIDLIKEIEGGLNKTTIKWSIARRKLLKDIEKNNITDDDIELKDKFRIQILMLDSFSSALSKVKNDEITIDKLESEIIAASNSLKKMVENLEGKEND